MGEDDTEQHLMQTHQHLYQNAYAQGCQQAAKVARECAARGMTPEQMATVLANLAAGMDLAGKKTANTIPG